MGTKKAERSRKNCYIFHKDSDALINFVLSQNSMREATGDLFGLWTTDGEPVIHIVCGQRLCTERRSNFDDTVRKVRPLSHLGNWRCYDQEVDQTHHLGNTRCDHETNAFLDLAICIKPETPVITPLCLLHFQKNGFLTTEKCTLELLKGESPFKNIEETKEIALNSRLDNYEIERSASKVSEDAPSNAPKQQGHTSVRKALSRKQIDKAEIYTGIGAKQSRTLYTTSNQRLQSDFGSNRNFKVFMFKEDCHMMENLVLEYPHLETGGDLFGLWTSNGDAVLHVVLGPGRNCKRTGASFFQDIPYLKRNGELLTQDYMLCHIGEWHSRHQLRLFEPSGGDSSTVIRNYPRGTCGFVLIIANIVSPREVKLSPYLYTEKSTYAYDEMGKIVVLPKTNAFNKIKKIKDSRESGKDIKCNLELLKGERPFKNIEETKEIALNSRLDNYEIERSASKVSEDAPSNAPKQQGHTSVRKALSRKQIDKAEIYTGIGAKQSRTLYTTSNQRLQSDFGSNRNFKVFMFKEDCQMMENLVLEYPHLETGGDLFGLWTSNGDAVLHVVLGPGRNCKRTGASFFQDIPYLKRNGELLTQDYMLCHIGEWHSRHQLRLFEPSGGDSSTVIRNYPRGTCGFVLIIANIVSPREVKLSPYLYTEKSTYAYDEMGKIVVLPKTNAFNKIKKIKDSRDSGKDIKVA